MADIKARLVEMENAETLLTKIYDEVLSTRETVKSIVGQDALSSVWSGSSCDAFVSDAVTKILNQFEEVLKNVASCNNALRNIIQTYATTEQGNVTKINTATEGFKQPTYDTI